MGGFTCENLISEIIGAKNATKNLFQFFEIYFFSEQFFPKKVLKIIEIEM